MSVTRGVRSESANQR